MHELRHWTESLLAAWCSTNVSWTPADSTASCVVCGRLGMPLQPGADASSGVNLWSECEAAGISACLLTDREAVAKQAEQLGCGEAAFLSVESNDETAATTDDCASMQLFYAAAELASQREGVVWIHSSGLNFPWDAPEELRASFTDPEDPDPPSEVGPPNFTVGTDTDPDKVVGWGQVAAAQSSVIDEGLATLLGAMHSRLEQEDWTVIILGLGGTPLGEHGQIGSFRHADGAIRQSLHGEELSVPAILKVTDSKWQMTRRGELFQLPDLGATILASSLGRKAGLAQEDLVWGARFIAAAFQRLDFALADESTACQDGRRQWKLVALSRLE